VPNIVTIYYRSKPVSADSKASVDAALFATKKARSRRSKAKDQKDFIRYKYRERGYKRLSCPNEDKWASYAEKKKSKSDALGLGAIANGNRLRVIPLLNNQAGLGVQLGLGDHDY
jgi:hypothetical protein